MTTKTDEQERRGFEAWHTEAFWNPIFDDEEDCFIPRIVQSRYEAYQAGRAALQSQDRGFIIEALKCAQNNECGPRRPFGSSDPDSDDYEHDAFMWDYYQRAIDHARRIEGEK